MARREATERNVLDIHDNLSGTDIRFFFRNPTTAEMEAYNNMAVQRKRKKVKFQHAQARLKYGLRVLTGIREGDFERKSGNAWVPLSSDQGSPNYYPEWKQWLMDNAADLVMLLGMHVFDASGEIEEGPDAGEEEGEDPNSPPPLPPSGEVSAPR